VRRGRGGEGKGGEGRESERRRGEGRKDNRIYIMYYKSCKVDHSHTLGAGNKGERAWRGEFNGKSRFVPYSRQAI